MNLLYCQMPDGNFGDDLNVWFWDRVAPGLVDGTENTVMFGMGTLLQSYYADQVQPGVRKVVIGAGAGAKGPLPVLDATWDIRGVRGPLTASYFGLSSEAVIGDPAILIGRFDDLRGEANTGGIGFMPHVWSLWDWDWQATCESLGLVFVDPRGDSRDTVRQISDLTKLIAEAMHGAIVADALRVPWIAASLSSRFEPSKWCDWAGSLGIDLHFHAIHPLYGRTPTPARSIATLAKDLAIAAGRAPNHLAPPNSLARDVLFAERQLADLARDKPGQLSDPQRLAILTDRLSGTISRLRDEELAARAQR